MNKQEFQQLKKILANNANIKQIKIYKHDGNVFVINENSIKITESQITFKQKYKSKTLTYKQIGFINWKK